MPVRALTFDVFGTTVDWCTGIARQSREMLSSRGFDCDWVAFANRWREQYQPAMEEVRSGRRPYATMDILHREMLDVALSDFSAPDLTAAEKQTLAHAWRRLDAWPDVIPAMHRMKARCILAALSNANLALATEMAKYAGLPWDVILGSELVQTYKPVPAIYDSASRFLDLQPSDIMMVACHVWDLRAAKARGLRTAYVFRPDEYGPGVGGPAPETGEFDLVARDYRDLAEQLDQRNP